MRIYLSKQEAEVVKEALRMTKIIMGPDKKRMADKVIQWIDDWNNYHYKEVVRNEQK